MIINVLIREVVDNVAIIDMFTSNRHLKVVKMIVDYDNLSKDANHSLSICNALKRFGGMSSNYSIQNVSTMSKEINKGAREFVSIVSTDFEVSPFENFDNRKWKILFTFKNEDATEFILMKTRR
jgi:hypothetical protein